MTATPRFSADRRQLARLAKALAHPARLAILQFLARGSSCYCGRIVDELPLAQATVSQHLRVLKSAGLIRGTVTGVKVCYCLDSAQLAHAAAAFQALFEGLRCHEPAGQCVPALPRAPTGKGAKARKIATSRAPA